MLTVSLSLVFLEGQKNQQAQSTPLSLPSRPFCVRIVLRTPSRNRGTLVSHSPSPPSHLLSPGGSPGNCHIPGPSRSFSGNSVFESVVQPVCLRSKRRSSGGTITHSYRSTSRPVSGSGGIPFRTWRATGCNLIICFIDYFN